MTVRRRKIGADFETAQADEEERMSILRNGSMISAS
jgi:hypothetical protein